MVAPGGDQQQGFTDRIPALALAFEQQPPDRFRTRRSAGSRSRERNPGPRKCGDEQPGLGRLAGPPPPSMVMNRPRATARFSRGFSAVGPRRDSRQVVAMRPKVFIRSTLAAATSGASTGGKSVAVTTTLPTVVPFSIGAGIGRSYST